MKMSIIIALLCISCGYGNLDYVRDNASGIYKENGFEIVGYEGYQIGPVIPFTRYGGARVYYMVKRQKSGVIYDCHLYRWGKEIHIYNLRALNVNKQNN